MRRAWIGREQLWCLNNLLLQDTNRIGEAEPLMRRALEIDEATFGRQHPTVADSLNNLATLLQKTNRNEEAEPLMRLEDRSPPKSPDEAI